jgi:hypothetical protein
MKLMSKSKIKIENAKNLVFILDFISLCALCPLWQIFWEEDHEMSGTRQSLLEAGGNL